MASKKINARALAMTAMLAALATVLMFFSFPVPFMPSFIKVDFSELPALIASFAFGPWSGAAVCLIKNLINALFTTTGCVGEFANFLLGCLFVVPAGIIYKHHKGRKSALIGSLAGALIMGIASILVNYYITYPVYTAFLPIDKIIAMYQALNPAVENLWQALIWFNAPFTFFKGLLSVIITFLIYKKISPLLKGKKIDKSK